MKINIESLLKKTDNKFHIEECYESEEYGLDIDRARLAGGLEVNGELHHVGDGIIRLRGTYRVKLEINCSRCLKPEIESRFKGIKGVFVPSGYEAEVDMEGDEYRAEYEENSLSLWDILRQDILLSIPMQPLCTDECKGLCPVCGQDLNEKDCGHKTESVDPRLEALKDIEIEE
ncbi:MAG: YceD family protein [bacterium]